MRLSGRISVAIVAALLAASVVSAEAKKIKKADLPAEVRKTVDRESSSVQAAIEKAKSQRYTVEQRLTNGELLYRTKDYPRAVVVFSEILEEFPDTPAYVDALWLRGETFYAAPPLWVIR